MTRVENKGAVGQARRRKGLILPTHFCEQECRGMRLEQMFIKGLNTEAVTFYLFVFFIQMLLDTGTKKM